MTTPSTTASKNDRGWTTDRHGEIVSNGCRCEWVRYFDHACLIYQGYWNPKNCPLHKDRKP